METKLKEALKILAEAVEKSEKPEKLAIKDFKEAEQAIAKARKETKAEIEEIRKELEKKQGSIDGEQLESLKRDFGDAVDNVVKIFNNQAEVLNSNIKIMNQNITDINETRFFRGSPLESLKPVPKAKIEE